MGINAIIYKYKGYKNEDELIDLMVKLISKLSRYKPGDLERDFIFKQIFKSNKYLSYIRTKISELDECISNCKDLVGDTFLEDDIERICDVDSIDKIIEIFKEKELPVIEVDAVIDEIGLIFEKVIGEVEGYIRDENGIIHKLGDNNEKYAELLALKYPGFKHHVYNDKELLNFFIEHLDSLSDNPEYEYDESQFIDGWYYTIKSYF